MVRTGSSSRPCVEGDTANRTGSAGVVLVPVEAAQHSLSTAAGTALTHCLRARLILLGEVVSLRRC